MQAKFIFGGSTGETPESLKRKRDIAAALLANQGTPRNIGEGIHALGRGITAGVLNKRAKEGFKSGTQDALDAFQGVFGGGTPSAATQSASGSPSQQAIASILTGQSGNDQPTGDTAQRLMAGLQDKFALSRVQAAGFVGNLAHESGNFKQLQELNPVVPGSRGGFGFAQWTGPRRRAFESFAAERGLEPSSFEANEAFLHHELSNTPEGAVLDDLRQASTPEQAATIVSNQFLRPGIPHMDSRIRFANEFAAGGQQQQPQAQPNAQARQGQLIQLLNNPFLPRGHREHVMDELRQIRQANDPLRRLEIQERQLRLEQLQNPPTPERKIIRGADGFQYYQDNGERVLPNVQKPAPDQPASVQEYEFARENGFEGSFVEFQNAKRGNGITITNPDGTITQIGGRQKAASESQSKANIYASRMEASNTTLDQLEAQGTQIGQALAAGVPLAGNFLLTPEYRQYEQAQRDFINATLRQESGAVISPAEFENARKQYFPQPGDDPETIAQKRRNREIAQQSIREASGPFQNKQNDNQNTAPEVGGVIDGYVFKGGDPSKEENWELAK